MKALFITKPFMIEPLGLMYISSSAKAHGHETDIALTTDDLEKKVSQFKPDAIGYSVITGDQDKYWLINKKLKENHKFVSIFGGPHPTFFPDFINEDGVDIICRGEGEQAFSKLLDSLEKGKDISGIGNLYVKHDGKAIQNHVHPLSDIESPFPDRDLVNKYPHIKNGPIKHFMASRGCPFNCSYCFNDSFFKIYEGKGKRVRFRGIDSVLSEVQGVVKGSPTKFVYFQDDTFTLNQDWLAEFSDKYPKRIGLPFHCHVRPNTIDEKKIHLLKKAGCYSVHIAAETADDRLRNEILNRKMSKEQITDASNLLRQSHIRFMMQNIIGLPTGSLEEDIKTLEMNIECRPDYAWVSIFQPYPGTRLGELCKAQGIYSGNFSDIDSNFFDSSKLDFSEEYKNQLSNLQKLFAIFVEHPELHNLGLSRMMINLPSEKTKESYKHAYQEFRKKADERLYGFKL